MSTDVLVKKLNREVAGLRLEIRRMREALLQSIADPEGEYRSTFVKKVLAREREKPRFRYAGRAAFLTHVRGK